MQCFQVNFNFIFVQKILYFIYLIIFNCIIKEIFLTKISFVCYFSKIRVNSRATVSFTNTVLSDASRHNPCLQTYLKRNPDQ